MIFFSHSQKENQLYYGPSEIVRALLNTEMQEYRCDVAELPHVYQQLPKGMAFQPDSELIDLFNYYIKKFAEEGQVLTYRRPIRIRASAT